VSGERFSVHERCRINYNFQEAIAFIADFNLIFYIVFFVLFIFYGQRIQTAYVMLREVEGSLYKLKYIKDEGRRIAIETIKEIGKPQTDPTARVDRFLSTSQ
jgi:hypothetical protein